jgi:hypothetical protein
VVFLFWGPSFNNAASAAAAIAAPRVFAGMLAAC